jgi:LAO/AO transport system kinase
MVLDPHPPSAASAPQVAALLARFYRRDPRALARALTLIEAASAQAAPLLGQLRQQPAQVAPGRVVGITGAPGAGKSSLLDQLIVACRARGEQVAVLAIDPSSPFSGGAILGDRIRMGRHHQDSGVFVRSMASRGALGGLARSAVQALALFLAYGFDWVFIETVGVGQSEIDIARVADHTVLLLTPAGGDGIQAFKAGIMEIADIIVINKADLPGADRLAREVRAALELAPHDAQTWWPPIIQTIANITTTIVREQQHEQHEHHDKHEQHQASGEPGNKHGIEPILVALAQHRAHLGPLGLHERQVRRNQYEVERALAELIQDLAAQADPALLAQVIAGTLPLRALLEGGND